MSSSSPKRQGRSPSPSNHVSDSQQYASITLQQIEVESLQTQIIAFHLQSKVVSAEIVETAGLRDKEQKHHQGGLNLKQYRETQGNQMLQDDERRHTMFEQMLSKENAELEQDIIDMENEIRRIQQERSQQASHYQTEIQKKEVCIKSMQSVNETLKFEVNEMRSRLHIDEIENRIEVLLGQNQSVFEEKVRIMDDLQTASQYILELEDKIHQSNTTSLELLKQLKDCENEIDTLKTYIIDLKSRIAVYIPVKSDSIDKKLAEYINNYPERSKLKIMFMRESEGIYQFGTKKVYVRVDQDKINIRVGGGFLSIDEFLDQYTPAELEKLERKDPLKRFHEKVAVQKAVVGHEVRENSPVNRASISPKRVKKIRI